MDKQAQNNYPIHEVIRKRWSPRAFDKKTLDEKKIMTLFEAARWAASSFNEQPWRFIYAIKQDKDEYEKLFGVLNSFNREWAKSAPMLILTVAKMNFTKTGAHNKHSYHDIGLAIGNLTAQATAMDLYLHQMAGFDYQKVLETFEIPAGFEPVTVIALGYKGNPDILPDDLAENEKAKRTRKPLDEIVFKGKWK